MRLGKNSVQDVLNLLSGYNSFATESIISQFCDDSKQVEPSVRLYGYYKDERLVSVMAATYMLVMPHEDSPSGRIVHISGAYTDPLYRHQNIASSLLNEIEQDAKLYFQADYICCDSTADGLYTTKGFKESEDSRLWKRLK